MKRDGVYTIWIFHSRTSKSYKIKLPGRFAPILFAAFVFIILSFPFITYHYISKSITLATIDKEKDEQITQIASLNKKVEEFNQQIKRLNEFDVKLRIIANLENAEETDSFLGVGGLTRASQNPWQEKETGLQNMGKELERLSTEAQLREKSFQELYSFLEGKKKQLACTPSIWPARGWLTSHFGYRVDPFTGVRQFHEGLDIANRFGTPIVATADGVVSRVLNDFGWGLNVEIQHGYGIVTRYAHLSKANVVIGQRVKRGDKIANIGNTGRATGPHLHYEVKLNDVQINPQRYILD